MRFRSSSALGMRKTWSLCAQLLEVRRWSRTRLATLYESWGAAWAGTWGYVEPSLVTFNTLISACGKAGKYAEAQQLFVKMQDHGLQPDNFTVCIHVPK